MIRSSRQLDTSLTINDGDRNQTPSTHYATDKERTVKHQTMNVAKVCSVVVLMINTNAAITKCYTN